MKKFFSRIFAVLTAAVISVTAAVIPVSAADVKIPDNEAIRFVNDLGAGWNLGNAFDAANCTWLSNKLDYEFGWCGVKTTRDHIKKVKAAGFSTIRIPVSWHDHVDSSNTIDSAWLNRVKEVVDWSLDEGLYVILNIHHDDDGKDGTAGYYPDSKHLDSSLKYVKAIWKQLSDKFKNTGDKLIFEALNEPNLSGNPHEWWWSGDMPDDVKDSIKCINQLNQAMLDTVRASGGSNKTRYLMFPSYAGKNDNGGVLSELYKLPTDTVKNRVIVDCHYYGFDQNEGHKVIDGLYNKFITAGIPVAITEYGFPEGNSDYAARHEVASKRFTEFNGYARARGISVVLWDDNGNFKLLVDRRRRSKGVC